MKDRIFFILENKALLLTKAYRIESYRTLNKYKIALYKISSQSVF